MPFVLWHLKLIVCRIFGRKANQNRILGDYNVIYYRASIVQFALVVKRITDHQPIAYQVFPFSNLGINTALFICTAHKQQAHNKWGNHYFSYHFTKKKIKRLLPKPLKKFINVFLETIACQYLP